MRLIHCCIITFLLVTFVPFEIDIHAEETLPKDMHIHFIDVGQGDSILIETPNDKHILIDGGRPEYGQKVVNYLKDHQVDHLDLLIATHPDYDHIGGLVDVMKEMDVDHIIDSGKMHNTKTYARYLNEIRKQDGLFNLAVENEAIDIDEDLKIKILNAYSKGKNNNQSSIVLKITYDEVNFLLMGDIEKEQEKDLIERYDLKANIIKVAHHGSKTSSSLDFLKAVDPEIAFLTYKKQNQFGHPVDRVITHLNKLGTQIYSTAVFGHIVLETNGKDYYIQTEKDPSEGIMDKAG